MAIKKINKANLTGVVITMLLVLGIFFGMFNWYSDLTRESGTTIDERYSNISVALEKDQKAVDNNRADIKGNVTAVKTADSIYQAAWNSFQGLGAIILMPITLITVASDMVSQIVTPVDFVPPWVKTLATIGIVAVIALLIVALLKGEQNKT